MDNFDIVVSGHLCLDLFPQMTHIPVAALSAAGRLTEVGAMSFSTGGAVSNTGLALHRLGINVCLMATVGDDLIGKTIISVLESRNVSLSRFISTVPGQPSSYTIVLSPEGVDRIFLHCTGTNSVFGAADVDITLAAQARLFHLGYPPLLPRLVQNDGEELALIFKRVKGTGAATSLDMSLPDPSGSVGRTDWVRILSQVLPFTDIFVPSIEEIMFALRRKDHDAWGKNVLSKLTATYLSDLADEMLAMGGVIVGFKLGTAGFYIKTGGRDQFSRLARIGIDADEWNRRTVYAPAYQVNVAGTTGAGDSAYAGFLAALAHRLPPTEAVNWACAVGACNVEAADAAGGIRTWEETEKRIHADWARLDQRIAGL